MTCGCKYYVQIPRPSPIGGINMLTLGPYLTLPKAQDALKHHAKKLSALMNTAGAGWPSICIVKVMEEHHVAEASGT